MTNDKPRVVLKPCPFCASPNVDPEGWATLPQYAKTPEERSGPACNDCGASAETVTIWNTRPPVAGAEVREDWLCVADILDDIEVDDKGMCRWSDVLNAQTHIRHSMRAIHRASAPQGDWREPVAWRWKDSSDDWLYSETEPTLLTTDRLNEVMPLYAAPPATGDVKETVALRANLKEAWAALAMIRETIETLGPPGAVKAAEHLDGPTLMHEADALVEGIRSLASVAPSAEEDVRRATIEECAKIASHSPQDWSAEGSMTSTKLLRMRAGIVSAIRALASVAPGPSEAAIQKSAPVCLSAHNSGERDPAVTPD